MLTVDNTPIDLLWPVMHAEKGDLITRSENYARLTLPYLCAPAGSAGSEQIKGNVAIGSRLINHLANKVVATMFPQDRPFFTIALTPDARRRLKKEIGPDQEAAFAEAVRLDTSSVEEVAVRKMDLVSYRPQAVEATKHLIVTGNALIRRLPNGKRVVYGVKDFCIRRDIDGAPIEIMLRDAKKFGSLPEALQQRVKQLHPERKDTDDCVLYTHYKLKDERWAMRQAVDNVVIDNVVRFKPVDLPVLPLTWTLARGENYARGAVEDHIVGFHQIDVSSVALIEMIGVMADIKFLVEPSSLLDVVELNNSPRGSYHLGRKDDISTPENMRRLEIAVLRDTIVMWERDLAQAFLLNSANVRDAERVTAEEIRFLAQELESAFGGLYSRFAIEWQKREADYAVGQIDFNKDLGSKVSVFEVLVTTGLESLSRAGQLQNARSALADLQMLDTVPEDLRAAINPLKFASFIFTNHTVKFQEFMYSPNEMKANQEQAQQLAGRQMDMQAQANIKQKAGEQAVQESNT